MSPSMVLDLTRRHYTRQHGPITVIGTWLRLEGEWQACLALVRTGEEYSEHTVPCIVPEKRAWIWNFPHGDPVACGFAMQRFIPALRLEGDRTTINFIADVIFNNLHELEHIPPYLPAGAEGAVIGELTITNTTTGKETEVVMRDV